MPARRVGDAAGVGTQVGRLVVRRFNASDTEDESRARRLSAGTTVDIGRAVMLPSAGDMIPANVRIPSCGDLLLTQAGLTGDPMNFRGDGFFGRKAIGICAR